MGAWGAGSFDNDAALDFAGEIESVADIEGVFVAVNDQGHVLIEEPMDADDACQVIVAAECVAAMRGHPNPAMPEELFERVSKMGKASQKLHELAKNNLSAATRNSELVDLWAEAGADEWGDFNIATTDLVDRLCFEPKKAGNPRKPKKNPVFNHSPCAFCDQPMGETEASMFDITVEADDISAVRLGGWAHLSCLNAVLHPKHTIQHWRLEGAELDAEVDRILNRDIDD